MYTKSRNKVYNGFLHRAARSFCGSLRADCRRACRTMQENLHNAGLCMAKCRNSCRTGAGARVSLWILWITRPLIHNRLWITRRKQSKSARMVRNVLKFIDCIAAPCCGSDWGGMYRAHSRGGAALHTPI